MDFFGVKGRVMDNDVEQSTTTSASQIFGQGATDLRL